MSSTTRLEYARRINEVIDFIAKHLDEELGLERLSRVAGFSKFHFHRQFVDYTGISVSRLVTLMRLKRASFQLAFNESYRVIDVALDAGFSSPEAFSRAFKRALGQSPSAFRANPEWSEWVKTYQLPRTRGRRESMEVSIVEFREQRVAVLEHVGPPETLMDSVGRFIEWRKSSRVSPAATSATYGVPYSDPERVAPEAFRFDICGATETEVPPNAYGVVAKTIPGGRCAVVRHHGSTDEISETVRALYGEWLPGSDETPRDFPCFFHYIERMPAVAEHEQITDVYLPLK